MPLPPDSVEKPVVSTPQKTKKAITEPKREFRAAWVATIANIDWPDKKGQTSEEQRQAFVKILDHHQSMGINAVIVQIRAASDAFYARSKEPWSEWLMGAQGAPPSPYYDPMVFMIDECHKRGMEFHAWFNLNRGKHKTTINVSERHITKTKPEWFMKYDGYELYDFGIPEVREYLEDVIIDVVKNYNIDGVHFDDYFYPYKVTGLEIPDNNTYQQYRNGYSNIGDWRRHNIDLLIKNLSVKIKEEKKWVKFGISPFCVWRNKTDDPTGSATQGGQPSYDYLFADTKKWAEHGWIDYIAPQIYFTFEFDKVPYATMTDWWVKNRGKALLYIGHAIYRVDQNSTAIGWNDPQQISRQIQYNRLSHGVSGSIFYNTNTLMKSALGVRESIKKSYTTKVLQPLMPWIDSIAPNAPEDVKVKKSGNLGYTISWDTPSKAKDKEEVWSYTVYRFSDTESVNLDDSGAILDVVVNDGTNTFLDRSADLRKNYVYVVTALDRLHNESTSSNPSKWQP
ncbi:Uncharacterized lipoprotein YddW, UPF0748 family [Spirosomataceae bacterium TFI 002]|nr:Uncharacterized lipoprotein YddW, UPF0748 family [Spirosomataceae bacterium TFI 002]